MSNDSLPTGCSASNFVGATTHTPINATTSFVGARPCGLPHHTEKLTLLQFRLLGGRPKRSADVAAFVIYIFF
jgi:hypothetical protein